MRHPSPITASSKRGNEGQKGIRARKGFLTGCFCFLRFPFNVNPHRRTRLLVSTGVARYPTSSHFLPSTFIPPTRPLSLPPLVYSSPSISCSALPRHLLVRDDLASSPLPHDDSTDERRERRSPARTTHATGVDVHVTRIPHAVHHGKFFRSTGAWQSILIDVVTRRLLWEDN